MAGRATSSGCDTQTMELKMDVGDDAFRVHADARASSEVLHSAVAILFALWLSEQDESEREPFVRNLETSIGSRVSKTETSDAGEQALFAAITDAIPGHARHLAGLIRRALPLLKDGGAPD